MLMSASGFDDFIGALAKSLPWRTSGEVTARVQFHYAKSDILLFSLGDAYVKIRQRMPALSSAQLAEHLLKEEGRRQVQSGLYAVLFFIAASLSATAEFLLFAGLSLFRRRKQQDGQLRQLFATYWGKSNVTNHLIKAMAEDGWGPTETYYMGVGFKVFRTYGWMMRAQIPSLGVCCASWWGSLLALWEFSWTVRPVLRHMPASLLMDNMLKTGGRCIRGYIHVGYFSSITGTITSAVFGLHSFEGFILDEYLQARGVPTVHLLHANITSAHNLDGFSTLAITRAECDAMVMAKHSGYQAVVNGCRADLLQSVPSCRKQVTTGRVLANSAIIHQSRYSPPSWQVRELEGYLDCLQKLKQRAGLTALYWRPHPYERLVLGGAQLRAYCRRYDLQLDQSDSIDEALSGAGCVITTPSAVWVDCLRFGIIPWVYTDLFYEKVGIMSSVPAETTFRTAEDLHSLWQREYTLPPEALALAWRACAADRGFILSAKFLCQHLPTPKAAGFKLKAVRMAMVWAQYGPYHLARLAGFQRHFDKSNVLGIEIGSRSSTYAWQRSNNAEGSLITLFPGSLAEDASILLIYRAALKEFTRRGVNVVFVTSYWPASSLAIILAARTAGARLVMMNESHALTAKAKGIFAYIKRRLILNFDAALVGGNPHRDYFTSMGMRREKIFLGYDVVDNDYFTQKAALVRAKREETRAKQGLPERYFLNVGRMVWKKNLETLVDAYKLTKARLGSDCPRLVLVGSGKLESSLRERCLGYGFSVWQAGANAAEARPGDADVFFYGFKQAEELPDFYALASAFILPSRVEEWGLVVNEAMACGLPVLVSRVAGCAQDLVRDSENGFLFDPFDISTLASHLEKFARHPALTDTMGAASQTIIADWGCDRFGRSAKEAAEIALK
jgi:1,2-diacylglycerol 3-alpha-glucosyltransferase